MKPQKVCMGSARPQTLGQSKVRTREKPAVKQLQQPLHSHDKETGTKEGAATSNVSSTIHDASFLSRPAKLASLHPDKN